MDKLNIDALDAIRGEVDALRLQCAVVDAINIFCRDVLAPSGALDETRVDASVQSRTNAAKYTIATRVALAALGRVSDLNWRAPLPPGLTEP
ncbi:MAG: hypothetical protein HOW73_29455 [Polyangiaceae bacterium]|nr:hypothetical protein [Polyangiaceae bacterium]